jgi:hypothetical protein
MVDSKFLQALLGCEVLYLLDPEQEKSYVKAYIKKALLNPTEDAIVLYLTSPDNVITHKDVIPLTVEGYTQRNTLFYATEEDDSLVTAAEYLYSIFEDFKNGSTKI